MEEESIMFEEIIRDLRLNRGLSQVELAKELFVTKQCVSNWENGRGRPDINLLPEICSALSALGGRIISGKTIFAHGILLLKNDNCIFAA